MVLDYSGCKGDRMIQIFDEAVKLSLSEGKSFAVLSMLDDKSFISPEFMRHLEKELPKVDMLIRKQAVIGLSTIQHWILKGMNLWYKRKVHSFSSMEEAMNFLVE